MMKRIKNSFRRIEERLKEKKSACEAERTARGKEVINSKAQDKAPNPRKVRFTAGGKAYASERQLMEKRLDDEQLIFSDCYGRRVLRIDERYPIFDSYDAMYENRYFHYYYIETPEGFACVRTADDQDSIPVREGISKETLVWERGTWHAKLLRAAGLMEKKA